MKYDNSFDYSTDYLLLFKKEMCQDFNGINCHCQMCMCVTNEWKKFSIKINSFWKTINEIYCLFQYDECLYGGR